MECPPKKLAVLERWALVEDQLQILQACQPKVTLPTHTVFFFLAISNGAFRTDPNSFLFSLVNPSGLQPTKMCLIPGKKGSAIHCHSSYGPRFGLGDLYIPNSPNSSNYAVSLNNTYQLPLGQNANTFLTGNQYFTLAEMEVFKFEK